MGFPSREWFMIDVRSGNSEELLSRFFAAGFDVFSPTIKSKALLPGTIFINTDPDSESADLRSCAADIQFVTNDGNRPMCVPSDVIAALRDTEGACGNSLRNRLATMAPEYRRDELKYWFHPVATRY